MTTLAETPNLVIVADEAVRWGVPARLVARVVEARDWGGSPPVDVARRLAADRPAAARRRVLVVAESGREQPLWTAGPILSRSVPPERVCAVPALVAAQIAPGVVAVVFADDGPVLVLDAWKLGGEPAR